MRWSVRFARVAGIDLKIHLTFLMFLAWIGFNYYAAGGRDAAIQGVLFILLLFACVLLHELGHALAARGFGIRTPDITLLPIGGIARLERIPEKPVQELVIALAGPLVNVVIALVLMLFLNARAGAFDLDDLQTPRVAMLTKLASVNIALVVFNLIPAFPMDGGRVLRALLAMRLNYARATQIAAAIGQGFAFVLGFFGLFGNPLLIFIALFVYLGASQEAALAKFKDLSEGLPVSEAMMTELKTLQPMVTLEEATAALLRTSQHEFPIVDEAGVMSGVLTREDLIAALRDRPRDTPIADVMHRSIPVVGPDDRLDHAFVTLQRRRVPALSVVDEAGRFVGLLTAENIGEMMIIRSLRPNEAKPARLAHA